MSVKAELEKLGGWWWWWVLPAITLSQPNYSYGGSQSKYKCSIIQTEQNTTKKSKYKHDKIQKNKIQIARIHL